MGGNLIRLVRRHAPFLMVAAAQLVFAAVAYGLNDHLFFGTVLVFGHFMAYGLVFKVAARFSSPDALGSNPGWKGHCVLITVALAFAALFYWYAQDWYETVGPLALALVLLVDWIKSLPHGSV